MARFAAIRGSVMALACAAALAACAREAEPTDNTVSAGSAPPLPLTVDSAPSMQPPVATGPAADTGAAPAVQTPAPSNVPASSNAAAEGGASTAAPATPPAAAPADTGHADH
ncbi:hypothetical protein [Longimicrobium sp.]|uniref:hypothetical protein n=1 Tax=Longimicrobium sp. TaxID=2029185 RepID=UPI002F926CB5